MSKATQIEKIVMYMLLRRNQQEWFYAPDFMHPALDFTHPQYVGYEASARISDLVRIAPDMTQVKMQGKYRYVRIRYESIAQWFPKINKNLRHLFHQRQVTPDTVKKVGEENNQLPLL